MTEGVQIYDGRTKADVGARLALTREVLGLRQGEFGERAGIKPSLYNQIESGGTMLSIERAHRLCDEYRLTLDWIYRGDPGSLEHRIASLVYNAHEARKVMTPRDT